MVEGVQTQKDHRNKYIHRFKVIFINKTHQSEKLGRGLNTGTIFLTF